MEIFNWCRISSINSTDQISYSKDMGLKRTKTTYFYKMGPVTSYEMQQKNTSVGYNPTKKNHVLRSFIGFITLFIQ